MEMKIPVAQSGCDLGPIEGASKAIRCSWPMASIGEDNCRSAGDTRQNLAEATIQANNSFTPLPALSSGNGDLFLADVRPGKPDQITQAKSCMRSEIYRISNIG